VATQNAQKAGGISNEAVLAKTGKGWEEWFALLDGRSATNSTHKEIARFLVEECAIGGWWAQTVTVGYEQARGMRQKHQKLDGFASTASRTIPVPLSDLYAAWATEESRKPWLPDPITVTSVIENKSLRAVSADGRTRISAYFSEKDDSKSQVSVQHEKLADADEVATSKAYWLGALDRLKAQLLE
jgi:hypothetical protein